MKRKNAKKILAITLSMLLLMGSFPCNIFAENQNNDSINKISTISENANIEETTINEENNQAEENVDKEEETSSNISEENVDNSTKKVIKNENDISVSDVKAKKENKTIKKEATVPVLKTEKKNNTQLKKVSAVVEKENNSEPSKISLLSTDSKLINVGVHSGNINGSEGGYAGFCSQSPCSGQKVLVNTQSSDSKEVTLENGAVINVNIASDDKSVTVTTSKTIKAGYIVIKAANEHTIFQIANGELEAGKIYTLDSWGSSAPNKIHGISHVVLLGGGELIISKGDFKITKTVSGEGLTTENLPSGFEITITDSNNNTAKLTTSTTKITLGTVEYDVEYKDYTWTISQLPFGSYSVSENNYDIENFSCSGDTKDVNINKSTGTCVTLNNVYEKKNELIDISVTKEWENNGISHPNEVVVELYADNVSTGKTIELNNNNNWYNSFKGLEKYKNGHKINYTIQEIPVENYTATISGNMNEGFKVKNTYTPEQQNYFGEINITKKVLFEENPIDVTDIFYAGIFEDQSCTKLVKDADGKDLILPIELNNESQGSIKAIVPVAKDGSDTTYYVKEVDENGQILNSENFEYNISILPENITVSSEKDGNVTIINEFKEEPIDYYYEGEINIEKRVEYEENPFDVYDTFYAGVFEDEGCTKLVKDADGKDLILPLVLNGNSSVSVKAFVPLDKDGSDMTYYVREVDADGNVINTGDDYPYDVTVSPGNITVNKDTVGNVVITNSFADDPEQYYYEGELTINKHVLGADGKAKKVQDIFFAGVYTDANCRTLLKDEDGNDVIVPLVLTNESSTSTTITLPLGENGENVTYYVKEVDENGNDVKGAKEFKYEVSIDNEEVTVSKEGAEVNITNKSILSANNDKDKVTIKDEKTPTGVKTSDESNMMMYFGIMILSICGLIFILRKMKSADNN